VLWLDQWRLNMHTYKPCREYILTLVIAAAGRHAFYDVRAVEQSSLPINSELLPEPQPPSSQMMVVRTASMSNFAHCAGAGAIKCLAGRLLWSVIGASP